MEVGQANTNQSRLQHKSLDLCALEVGQANTNANMELLKEKLTSLPSFDAETIEEGFKQYLTENELGMGAALPNFRLLVTGKGMGPSMFQIAALLGKKEVLNRFEDGLLKIAAIKEETSI